MDVGVISIPTVFPHVIFLWNTNFGKMWKPLIQNITDARWCVCVCVCVCVWTLPVSLFPTSHIVSLAACCIIPVTCFGMAVSSSRIQLQKKKQERKYIGHI
jgi:hypothetical protein